MEEQISTLKHAIGKRVIRLGLFWLACFLAALGMLYLVTSFDSTLICFLLLFLVFAPPLLALFYIIRSNYILARAYGKSAGIWCFFSLFIIPSLPIYIWLMCKSNKLAVMSSKQQTDTVKQKAAHKNFRPLRKLAFIGSLVLSLIVVYIFITEPDQTSYFAAQEYNDNIVKIKDEALRFGRDIIFEDIWNDKSVPTFYKKVTGIFDAHYKTEMNIDDFTQYYIVTPDELECAFENMLITYRIRILECLRDTIITDELDALASRALFSLNSKSGQISSNRIIGSSFICNDLKKSIEPLIGNRSISQKLGFSSRDLYISQIKQKHKEIFMNKLEELLNKEARRWMFSKYEFLFRRFKGASTRDTDFKTLDAFLILVEANLAKAKITGHVTSYTRNFLKENVAAANIADYREIFYGPFDIVRSFIKKHQGEKEFQDFAFDKFSKYVFTPAQFEQLSNDLAKKTETEIKASVMEYFVNASEYKLSRDIEVKSESARKDYFESIMLPKDKQAVVMSMLDMIDTGVIFAQLLGYAGIVAAPATGGVSLVLTVAGYVLDSCLAIKEVFINPAHEVVEVVKIRNNVQNSLYNILLFNNKESRKGFLEGAYEVVDKTFKELS